jgi:hypothetical protein
VSDVRIHYHIHSSVLDTCILPLSAIEVSVVNNANEPQNTCVANAPKLICPLVIVYFFWKYEHPLMLRGHGGFRALYLQFFTPMVHFYKSKSLIKFCHR